MTTEPGICYYDPWREERAMVRTVQVAVDAATGAESDVVTLQYETGDVVEHRGREWDRTLSHLVPLPCAN